MKSAQLKYQDIKANIYMLHFIGILVWNFLVVVVVHHITIVAIGHVQGQGSILFKTMQTRLLRL